MCGGFLFLKKFLQRISLGILKPCFFKSGVMRMCRIPSGKIIKENIHAALRHNVYRVKEVNF